MAAAGEARGPPPPTNHGPFNKDDGGDDGNISRLVGALVPHGPALLVGLTAIAVGVFHQCVFALPAMQRDVTELRTGLAEPKFEPLSSHAELKLMMQQLCVAMEKPEDALPLSVCA